MRPHEDRTITIERKEVAVLATSFVR